MKHSPLLLLCIALAVWPSYARAQDSDEEIAKKLNNPVASIISMPFQANWDFRMGPLDKGTQFKLNFQPVIPVDINDDWKVIIRTIVPYIAQEGVFTAPLPSYPGLPDRILRQVPEAQRDALDRVAEKAFNKAVRKRPNDRHQDGLGDIAQTFFFSPKRALPEEYHFGIGPIVTYPTATEDLLGSEKWAAGPAVLFLRQAHGWTMGFLANHQWSYAGNDERDELNITNVQPFLNYQTKTHTTIGVNAESIYDWNTSQWTVPVNASVTQLVRIGKMPVSFQVGARYYAEGPSGAPDWGLRATITLVLPEGHRSSPPPAAKESAHAK
jgi:hypothetical protein